MTAPGRQAARRPHEDEREDENGAAGRRPLFDILTGTWLSQAGHVAAVLGVADHLSPDEPRPVDEVARLVGAHPDALYRLLRALASAGIFVDAGDRRFALNAAGAALRSGAPFNHFLAINGAEHIHLFAEIAHTVRTGAPATDRVYGGDHFFAHLVGRPDAHRSFLASHGPSAHEAAAGLLAESDLSGARTIVDVGGGDGGLLEKLLLSRPHLRGVLFDLPETLALARDRLDRAGLADRVELVGGSFLESVPEGGDVYVIAHCLHNWNDENARRILRTIRAALPPGGRLLVLERFIAAGTGFHPAKVMDLLMLMIDGRERTEAEYRELIADAGFDVRVTRSLSAPGLPTDNVFEAVPAPEHVPEPAS